MAKINMTKIDAKWQAESDAQTMAQYQEIMNDKTRMSRAIKVAQKRAQELSSRAKAMQDVAKRGMKKK